MKQLESNQDVDMTVRVIDRAGVLSAVVTQTIDGQTSSYDDVVEVMDAPVRPRLNAELDADDLNQAERLIVHAMMLTNEPMFAGAYSAGLELSEVRSVKMYTVGKTTRMGSATLVEARDADGRVLGSFLGGFLVSPCR